MKYIKNECGSIVEYILMLALEAFKVIGITVGIFFGLTLLIGGIAFAVQHASEKEKRGLQNVDELLRLLIRKKPRKVFALLQGTTETHYYRYEANQYEWLLHSSLHELDIKLNEDAKPILHITYDKKTETFTRKNLKADVFQEGKTLKQLDKLVAIILATDWNEHLSFNLVSETDELSKEIPQPTAEAREEHFIITDPMIELETYAENIIEDVATKGLFQTVIENMHDLRDYHLELDIETKHMIEYSLTNDLNRLLSLYEELNEDQKESLADEIQDRLHLMNEKVESIKEKLNAKKANEIQKALHLFDKRYQV